MHLSEVIEPTIRPLLLEIPLLLIFHDKNSFPRAQTCAVFFIETVHASFTGSDPLIGAVNENLKVPASKKQPNSVQT
jgi:hypothetical protein